jgi:hypothetical protein
LTFILEKGHKKAKEEEMRAIKSKVMSLPSTPSNPRFARNSFSSVIYFFFLILVRQLLKIKFVVYYYENNI